MKFRLKQTRPIRNSNSKRNDEHLTNGPTDGGLQQSPHGSRIQLSGSNGPVNDFCCGRSKQYHKCGGHEKEENEKTEDYLFEFAATRIEFEVQADSVFGIARTGRTRGSTWFDTDSGKFGLKLWKFSVWKRRVLKEKAQSFARDLFYRNLARLK